MIEFDANPPATLPFLLLSWIQTCIKFYECKKNLTNIICNKILNDIEFDKLIQICRVYNIIAEQVKSISHIYYTESDQILRFKNEQILQEILYVSNKTTLIMGYRKQKDSTSLPEEYMSSLYLTRPGCGRNGYFLNTKTHQIYQNHSITQQYQQEQEQSKQQQEQSKLNENVRLSLRMKHRNSIMFQKQQRDSILRMKNSYKDS